ncbi:MAG: hypothetical protein Q9227_003305 [Pyrenula ochraceoflavens]
MAFREILGSKDLIPCARWSWWTLFSQSTRASIRVKPTMAEPRPLLRPQPRRPFELPSDTPESPALSADQSNNDDRDSKSSERTTPSRTRSILNLTTSTLYGIYSPAGADISRGESTPWTGSQTPASATSPNGAKPPVFAVNNTKTVIPVNFHRRKDFRSYYLPMAIRSILLFAFGVAYQLLISHLHDKSSIAPVKINAINRDSWFYSIFWGCCGIALGSLLPWVDTVWAESGTTAPHTGEKKTHSPGHDDTTNDEETKDDVGASWNPVVRSVGAFIGITFAIRRLPWESTLQMSLTLALANPALWYLIDRSTPGLIISTLVGLFGTVLALVAYPNIIPQPSTPGSTVSPDVVGVSAWVASVLFCSCVCFGNIGRRLALTDNRHGSVNEFYWSVSTSN